MSLRTVATSTDDALGLSRISLRGLGRRAGNLLRILVLLGSLWTLALARQKVPIWFLVAAVAVSLAAMYAIDRRSGRFGLWAAYVIGFILFALLRTTADETGIAVKADYVVDADKALFGGVLPQEWLQRRLYDVGTVGALEVFVVAVVFSYFVVPHLIALVLWRRDFAAFKRYCPVVLLTVYMGLAASYVLPTAPPWLASQFTDAPPVARVVADVLGWNPENIGPGSPSNGLNPVAAMPSLHFAMTTLIVIALWRRPFLRTLALLYAAAMAFALTYGGEHFVVDELAGAATAALAWLVVKKVRLARTARAPALSPAVPTVASASTAD
jgi:hypothetical protein